jgi:hypothetical protein
MEPNIVYTYKDCKREDFRSDVHFNEDLFSKKLTKVFETSIRMDRVEVIITKNDNRTLVRLDLLSPDLSQGTIQKEGFESAKAVFDAIDSAVHLVHDAKEKHTHH